MFPRNHFPERKVSKREICMRFRWQNEMATYSLKVVLATWGAGQMPMNSSRSSLSLVLCWALPGPSPDVMAVSRDFTNPPSWSLCRSQTYLAPHISLQALTFTLASVFEESWFFTSLILQLPLSGLCFPGLYHNCVASILVINQSFIA